MNILFFIVIGYFSYNFIQVLGKVRQRVISPTTNEELATIRKHPERKLDFPTYSKQKVGIITYSIMLLFVIVMFLLDLFLQLIDWPIYLLVFPILAYSYNALNIFAVTEDGLLDGVRFIPWGKVTSFRFVRIDINHKYYGFSKEANEGYELKIKAKFYSISCIVTSAEMKEKLSDVLSEHIKVNERESAL